MKKKYSRAYIEITNVCNRSCSFCPGTKRAPDFIDIARFSHLTDELVGITDYVYLHLMGEPLLHPELSSLIRHATDKGFKVAFTTNGTLIRERSEELLSSGLYKINLSLHSFEEGTKEDEESYLSGILDFADRASASGILVVLRLWNKGADGGRNVGTVSRIREKFPNVWVESQRGARIRDKLHLEYGERFIWPDRECESIGDGVFCHGLGDHFGVLVDGTVVPCCLDREGVINLGNLYSKPLSEILSSERAEAIRDGFAHKRAAEDLCRGCRYARRFKV